MIGRSRILWRHAGWRGIGLVALLTVLAACSSGDEQVPVRSEPSLRSGPGGVLDSGFGNGGTAVIGATSRDTVNALLPGPTDTTVAIGSSVVGDKSGFLLMRVRGDGSLDPSFGTGGRVATAVGLGNAEGSAAAALPDGSIVVAGSAESPDGGDPDIALARYSADGALDSTFGRGGIALAKMSAGADTAFAVAIDGGSRVVVGGQCGRANARENTRGTACVVRFGANGDVDTAFGPGGGRLLPLREGVESLRGIAIDGRGRILASGYSAYGASANELTVFRLTPSGDPDGDFGELGSAAYRGRGFSDAFAMALQGDGVLVAGFSGRRDGSGKDFLVARFSGDGQLDEKFGDGGAVMTPIGPGDDVAFALATDARGIVVAGYASNGSDNDLAVVRYSTSGRIDESFGKAGTLTVPLGGMAVARGLVVNDSKITVAGELRIADGRSAVLARILD